MFIIFYNYVIEPGTTNWNPMFFFFFKQYNCAWLGIFTPIFNWKNCINYVLFPFRYSQAEIENPIPPFTLTDCSVHEESTAEIGTIDKSASIIEKEETAGDENASTSTEQMDVEQKNDEPSSGKHVEDNATKENLIEIQKKYDVIEKFINGKFSFKMCVFKKMLL